MHEGWLGLLHLLNETCPSRCTVTRFENCDDDIDSELVIMLQPYPSNLKALGGSSSTDTSLGMGSPFISSGVGALDSLGFMSRSAKRREQVWENLHMSPRTASSKGAKLCTYHHWFGRPSDRRSKPYFELPMGISKLRALVQFRLGSHTLPIEQGHFARPALPRHFRLCTRLRYMSCGR